MGKRVRPERWEIQYYPTSGTYSLSHTTYSNLYTTASGTYTNYLSIPQRKSNALSKIETTRRLQTNIVTPRNHDVDVLYFA